MLSLANAAEEITFTAAITPYLPLLGVAVGAILLGLFNSYNRRKGNIETRAPDVNQIWQQQQEQATQLDLERKMRRKLEDYVYSFRAMFINYVKRVQKGGSTQLTASEQKFVDKEPTTVEMKVARKQNEGTV